jgi:hypothetical protein
LSRDPISYLAGLNLYQYSSNNPVNCADPLGLWSWKSVASIAAAVVVGIVVVAALANPIGLAAAIILGGAAAGAVGFGLNEALNEKQFSPWCIFKEALRGAFIGALAAIPFAVLPAAAGVAAFMSAGADSGAISYIGNWATSNTPWSWGDFALSVGIGAVTAGAGRFLAGRYAAWKLGGGTPDEGEVLPGPRFTDPLEHAQAIRDAPVGSPERAALVDSFARDYCTKVGAGAPPNRIVLGPEGIYNAEAEANGGIYYRTPEGSYGILGRAGAWETNQAFLDQQMEAGLPIEFKGVDVESELAKHADTPFADAPARIKEIRYLQENGPSFGYVQDGNTFVKIPLE